MRGFSYRFAKSYPISSQEFEIETEMTIFALNNNFLIEEVNVEYRDRIEGSESKLTPIVMVLRCYLLFFHCLGIHVHCFSSH